MMNTDIILARQAAGGSEEVCRAYTRNINDDAEPKRKRRKKGKFRNHQLVLHTMQQNCVLNFMLR